MIYVGKRLAGFTLAEVTISFIIIAIIVMATLKIQNSQVEYAQKQVAKATFNNLRSGIGNLIAEGYTSGTSLLKGLNPVAHVAADNSGFCDRLASTLSTVPIAVGSSFANSNCATATAISNPSDSTQFNSSSLNFKTANGAQYYNFGKDASGGQYTVYVDINTGKNQGKLNTNPIGFNSDPAQPVVSLNSFTLNGSIIKFNITTSGVITAP